MLKWHKQINHYWKLGKIIAALNTFQSQIAKWKTYLDIFNFYQASKHVINLHENLNS